MQKQAQVHAARTVGLCPGTPNLGNLGFVMETANQSDSPLLPILLLLFFFILDIKSTFELVVGTVTCNVGRMIRFIKENGSEDLALI